MSPDDQDRLRYAQKVARASRNAKAVIRAEFADCDRKDFVILTGRVILSLFVGFFGVIDNVGRDVQIRREGNSDALQ